MLPLVTAALRIIAHLPLPEVLERQQTHRLGSDVLTKAGREDRVRVVPFLLLRTA